MDVYIDLDHLRSLARSASHPQFFPCLEALRRHCDLFFTFDKHLLLKEKKEARRAIDTLLRSFTYGRGEHHIEWNHPSPLALLPADEEAEAYARLTPRQLMSLYLLTHEHTSALARQGCLLIAPVGSELKTIARLFLDEQPIPSKKYAIREMTDWDLLRRNALPSTDIVIIDPYLFAQSDWLYDHNSLSVIEQLATHACDTALNIVIFTKPEYAVGEGEWQQVDFIGIDRRIKEAVAARTGRPPRLTLVCLPQRTEHDRTILTNYRCFDSGDSFKYFDTRGQRTSHGSWLYVNSHLDAENQRLALAKIAELQQLLDNIKDGVASITGDKRSNFLRFG